MLEEVDVGKLLHLVHIGRLGYLFIIEEDPRWLSLTGYDLPYEGNIVAATTERN
jgi:hypothetical protein